jgi:two-component system, OmpR family, response regulator VanR
VRAPGSGTSERVSGKGAGASAPHRIRSFVISGTADLSRAVERPIALEECVSEMRPGDLPALANPESAEIMIVEDSMTQAVVLQQMLERAGYRVSAFAGAGAALQYLEENRPTLILTDIVMPGMDGFELCRRIKDTPGFGDVPVVLGTFLSDPADILRGLESGADSFITKPYDESSLISRIQYLLINTRLRQGTVTGMGMQVFFAGRKHFLTSERMQIIDLLLSTFETAVSSKDQLEQANRELLKANHRLKVEIAERKRAEEERQRLIAELQRALAQVKRLSGFIPICASCKKIRDDSGYWQQIEKYIRDHSEADFSHSICPDCVKKLYPDFAAQQDEQATD